MTTSTTSSTSTDLGTDSETTINARMVERLQRLLPLALIQRKSTLPFAWMDAEQRQLIAEFEAVYNQLGREWPALVAIGEQAGLTKVDLGMLIAAGVDLQQERKK